MPISLKNLTKIFGTTRAVNEVNLDIPAGALFFLLGPSGCGKTTLLRMIAGFTLPDSGQIHFGDQDMSQVPPHLRNTGMVFQSYALWPHMNVAQNVGFGLDVRNVRGADKDKRIAEALELVQMSHLAKRKPNQLSGGQQQRVALARAIVIRPQCLLLDEPLSNLDAKLRAEMRYEIRRVVKQVGITAIYVTHDQKEALSMADGIAVMQAGVVQQTGTPAELYRQPRSRFVADFIGESNFLAGTVTSSTASGVAITTAAGNLEASPMATCTVGQKVTVAFRPEAAEIVTNTTAGTNILTAQRQGLTYLGEMAEHQLQLADGQTCKVFQLNPPPVQPAQGQCQIRIKPEDLMVLAA